MGAEDTEPRAPRRLSAAECWSLLERATLGRLALLGLDGTPDIYPVNFTVYERAIYLRSAHDTKLAQLREHPVAAFEIDGEDESSRWSVVARGPAGRLADEDEIIRSGVLQLVSFYPSRKHHVVKVSAHSVTGRRLPKVDTDLSVHEPTTSSSTAPIAIPHLPPRRSR